MDAILDFKAGLVLGDTAVSAEEIRRLLEESEGLALIKGRWVEVDGERLRQTLQAYEQAQAMMAKGDLTLREAMRLQLRTGRDLGLSQEQVDVSISHGQWLASVMDRLRSPQRIDTLRLPKVFRARLRPYQHRGLDWLGLLDSLQLGACLADDMGLGKTVELLALLSVLKDRGGRKTPVTSLLVIPASLIGNWVSEIERFPPSLRYIVAHPAYGTAKAGQRPIQRSPRTSTARTWSSPPTACARRPRGSRTGSGTSWSWTRPRPSRIPAPSRRGRSRSSRPGTGSP